MDVFKPLVAPQPVEKPLAAILSEDSNLIDALSGILDRLCFAVIIKPTIEELLDMEPDTWLQVRLLILPEQLGDAEGQLIADAVMPFFPQVPTLWVGNRTYEPQESGCAVPAGRIGTPLDEYEATQVLEKAVQTATSLNSLIQRNVFFRHGEFIEEPIARIIRDINNQLTGLKGGIDLLSYSVDSIREPDVQAKFQRYLDQFIQPSLAQIEHQVSNWRRLRENRPRPLVTTDLRRVINTAIAMAATEPQRRHIEVEFCDIGDSEEPLPVKAHPSQLGAALACLIQNASEAVEGAADPKVKIQVSRQAEQSYRIGIYDNGPGISDNLKSQVWKTFFTTKSNWKNGLGLTIAKQLVEKNQGTIDETESPLGGAGFEVILSAAENTQS